MSTPLSMGWQPPVHWLTTFLKTQWSGSRAALETDPLLPGTGEIPTFLIPGTPLQSDAHSGQHGGEPPCYEILKLGSSYTPFTTKSRTEDGGFFHSTLQALLSSFDGVVEVWRLWRQFRKLPYITLY